MAENVSFLESLKDKLGVTRRQFVQGMTAACAAASVLGCSGSSDGGGSSGDLAEDPNRMPPEITEEVYEGASPHNCGGGCLLKAYVSNGVIKRFTTDERPEKSYLDATPGDYAQERVCPRCRGQKGWIYGSNRLTYPLIQTGERGNLSTFKRVTWAEAGAYFKAKLEKVRNTYGPAAFHHVYNSGMGGGYDPSGALKSFSGSAAWMATRDDYSFPEWEHTHRIMHDEESQPKSNDQQDAFNSTDLVVWCYNLTEMFNQQQITWMYRQIKEKGVKVTVIDQHQSRTALYADDFVAPVHATDTAMMLAMIHTALTEYKSDLYALYNKHAKMPAGVTSITNDDQLRKAVGQYLYGFFDTNATDGAAVNESYTLKSAAQTLFLSNAKVPSGASLAAYVFGNTTAPGNATGSKSIYPDKIGYNVRSYQIDSAADPLAGKFTNAYGQVVKDAAWAEKITGVPAAKIKELTKMFLTKDVTCWTMGGQQRNSEGEQVCWMYTVLMTFFLCFGKKGRTFGRPYGKGNDTKKGISLIWSPDIKATDYTASISSALKVGGAGYADPVVGQLDPYLVANPSGNVQASWTKKISNTAALTFKINSTAAVYTTPVFTWLDAVEATNSPKVTDTDGSSVWPSRWNDGQIKRLPVPIKFVWCIGGNTNLNQNGDTNLATKVFNAKDNALIDTTPVPGVTGVQMNPKGYKLEFMGLCDVVMTPSARYCDLVLPGVMGFERFQGGASGRSPMTYVTKKVSAPQGDALAEIQMGAEICAAFGKRDNYYNGFNKGNGLTFEEHVWRDSLNAPVNTTNFDGRDFDGWVKNGMSKGVPDLTRVANYICYEQFLKNPGTTTVPAAKPNQSVNSTKTAFWTISGRVEAFSLLMMEDYEMRYYNNIDSSAEAALMNGGKLNTKTIPAGNADETKGRYVYPIPMYIPIIEGRHHDDTAAPHPDPLGIKATYPLSFHTWHMIYRSHSTFNSSPYTNEVKYYKRDKDGKPAHLKRTVTNVSAGVAADNVTSSDTKAPMVWMDNVYETVWMNPDTAATYNVTEGMPVICESPRGKIKVSAHLSERIRPGVVMIGQGSWYNPDNSGAGGAVDKGTIDIGGNANTLFGLRPSRIGQGMTLASDCRIKIYPA